MKTHTLEAGQFIEFINPWKEWNTEWNDVNCGNTNEMSMWPSQWIAIFGQAIFGCFAHQLRTRRNKARVKRAPMFALVPRLRASRMLWGTSGWSVSPKKMEIVFALRRVYDCVLLWERKYAAFWQTFVGHIWRATGSSVCWIVSATCLGLQNSCTISLFTRVVSNS